MHATTRPTTILLAEDSHSVRNVARKLLERAGFDVLATEDGVEALETLSRERERIGVLVTDLNMPRMGGAELAMRGRIIVPGLRVIIISGHAGEDESGRDPRAHGDMILDKPFTAAALIGAVQQLMGPISSHGTLSLLR